VIPNKTILVGGTAPAADDGPAGWQRDIVRANSYRDLQRLLEQDSTVHLVCTDMTLPDGNWCDVLRLVISARMTGEVRVVGVDGRTVLRLEVAPRICSVRAFDAAMHQSLAYDSV
jgi:hypothetical protein